MPPAWLIVLLYALCAIALGGWIIITYRFVRMVRLRHTVRAGLDLAAHDGASRPRVSVIVPAHDEEKLIDRCARSLRNQHWDDLELIFVLDRCTDGTASILAGHCREDERIIVIENESCPADWAGKCHAARLGADRATGGYLLFTDADTVFDPDLVRAAVALARERKLGLLSLLSTLTSDLLFERIAQPVASIHLIRLYPIERVNRPDRENVRPFANGQFMLFLRSEYDRIGGHAAVHSALLEDIAFARRLHESGGKGGVFLADRMLGCSMYDSLPAFRAGWKRIFIEACKRKPRELRKNGVHVAMAGIVLPLAQLAGLVTGCMLLAQGATTTGAALVALVVVGWLLQYAILQRAYSLMGVSDALSPLTWPIGSAIVARILFAAASDLARRRAIPWAGREYVLEPRGP